jgi:hypothetical protein
MKVVRKLEPVEITNALHPHRRIVILERDDGRFSFAEEYYYVSEYEGEVMARGWARLPVNGVYETADIAEREGRAALLLRHNL